MPRLFAKALATDGEMQAAAADHQGLSLLEICLLVLIHFTICTLFVLTRDAHRQSQAQLSSLSLSLRCA
eukprot:6185640-Pleurochrysis_carterae.AAC.2